MVYQISLEQSPLTLVPTASLTLIGIHEKSRLIESAVYRELASRMSYISEMRRERSSLCARLAQMRNYPERGF